MIRQLALGLLLTCSTAATAQEDDFAWPADPDLRFIEITISSTQRWAFLVQTCGDLDRERRLERQLIYNRQLSSDYKTLTGREPPDFIDVVEGDVCEGRDHFDENMLGRWRDLREVRKLLDELKASS